LKNFFLSWFLCGSLFREIFLTLKRVSDGCTEMHDSPIQKSFELAATVCADLTPLVYRRLFAEHPETAAMFRTTGSDLVKGSMLALTIEAILDFAGERSGRFRMIECEAVSHDAYGTSRDLFMTFFGVIAGTLRELLARDWTDEMEDAWQKLLVELESIVARQDIQHESV
jgi:hemoglobin-like flavoprotein